MGVPQPKVFSQSSLKSLLTEDSLNNNFLVNPDVTMNNISEFYENTKIFITGATGFVGKALVEKLLRSCEKIDAIFLLIRPKKGMTIENRVKELLKNTVFSRIREKNPDAFEKVKVISGDVSQPNLGLSENDKKFLEDNIDIVFHSAATVKFNESLKNAVILNTLGTKRVLEICKQMKKLKRISEYLEEYFYSQSFYRIFSYCFEHYLGGEWSFVHVSTAFCNSDKDKVEEMVYKPSYDAYAIMNMVENLPDDVIESISKRLVGNHPNTYTFTKALAEQIVMEYSSDIPLCVVRPSIITAAWKEPFTGWVDNVSGITGILMECGRGTIKTILCNDQCRMDLIPVDIVVNTLITSAWHTVAYSSNTSRIYNCTSGKINPVTWKEFGHYTHKHSVDWPSKYVTWYPGFTYRTSRTMHVICATMYHFIPSAILDLYLYGTGKKPMMWKITKKFYQALEAGSFFSTNEWDFGLATMRSLVQAVHHAEDGSHFELDLKPENGFNWDTYVRDFLIGIRQYVLKDDLKSLPSAKTKLNRLYWFQRIFQIFSMYLVWKLIMSYF